MEVELIEIREFLASHPPFDQLPEDALDRLPRELVVRYLRRGTPFPPGDAAGDYLYMVRRGAVEMRNPQDELVDKFGEGDLCTAPCMGDAGEVHLHGTVVEDSLLYLLPCQRLDALREQHPQFAEHFNQSVRERLRSALEGMQETRSWGPGLMSVELQELISRSPVTASPETTIRDAATIMTRNKVSSLLIVEGHRLAGIVTDRDLRSRCIAEGLSTDRPVSDIMTRSLHRVAPDTRGFDALITMTRLNVHHLPVMDRDGIAGVVTANDLMRYQSTNAVYLVRDVRKCESVEALVQVSRELPELQVQLVASGAAASHLGQTVSSVTDAITTRLLELAQEQLGEAPVPYAWLACGSQGRREQTVLSDQDNVLLLSDDYDESEHGRYFEKLTRFVNEGLDRCGFYFCPGDVMASNPQWRQPYRKWRSYFDSWITRPEKKSLMYASNFFDLRFIQGEELLYDKLHAEVLQQTGNNKIFLAYMAANALHNRPPLGFFRNFVLISGGDHARTFDLKRRAIIPIVDLARVYALSAGLPEVNSNDRLKAAAEAVALSEEGAESLEEALEFIATLRARHQARQIKRGETPDNYVRPDELSKLERGHLKDAFSVISTMQDALGQRYQSERFT